MENEARRALQGLPLFRGLSEQALETLASRAVVRTLSKNTLLFREGEPARGLYIVLWGSIEIYRSTPEGKEHVIHVERTMHHLGELPLLDGSPYPASARAGVETRIVFLTRDAFQWAYRENPEIADVLIRDLSGRLRKMVALVEKLTLKDVPARVATAVLEVAIAAGKTGRGDSFHLPLTQDELAAQLATTRESVSRAMARLTEGGALTHRGSRVTIVDIGTLEKLAGGTLEAVEGSLFGKILPPGLPEPGVSESKTGGNP